MHSVTHFNLPVDDPERAQEFYRSLFGWNIRPIPELKYFILLTSECDEKGMPTKVGTINGGMYKREGKEPVTIVINVPSLDEALKKVETAGGKIDLPKREVGDFGFYARIIDTEGNPVGLWEDKKKKE